MPPFKGIRPRSGHSLILDTRPKRSTRKCESWMPRRQDQKRWRTIISASSLAFRLHDLLRPEVSKALLRRGLIALTRGRCSLVPMVRRPLWCSTPSGRTWADGGSAAVGQTTSGWPARQRSAERVRGLVRNAVSKREPLDFIGAGTVQKVGVVRPLSETGGGPNPLRRHNPGRACRSQRRSGLSASNERPAETSAFAAGHSFADAAAIAQCSL